MSRDKDRRFYEVAVEPSAAALLESASQALHANGPSHSDIHDSFQHDEANHRQSLPSYFAFNFNFKPDSTHDCKRGALFQPGNSRNPNADWQFELESNELDHVVASSSTPDVNEDSNRNPAHVFTGHQTASKAYDLVLVWDDAARVYRLDRIASTFSLKYERNKTVLSAQSQSAWSENTAKQKKRLSHGSSVPRSASSAHASERREESKSAAPSVRNDRSSHYEANNKPSALLVASGSSKLGNLKLRSNASTVMAPVRRSSRRSLAVEMEEFDDRPEAPTETSTSTIAGRSKRSSVSKEGESPGRNESKKTKLPPSTEKQASLGEPAGALRRSRRRSSQVQVEESSSPSHRRASSPTSEIAANEKVEELEALEVDDDDLALELERELEREIEIEMEDVSENDEQEHPISARSSTAANPKTDGSLSPGSRLKHGDRQAKISTPKAHTPDLDDISALCASTVSKSLRRSFSPSTDASTLADDGKFSASQTTASIGLGLQQTGVGITPTASPHLDIVSPTAATIDVRSPSADPGLAEAWKASEVFEEVARDSSVRDDDDEDDDLQDFAAELDMSLAEVPDASPVAVPAVVEKRRSSRTNAATQSAADARGSNNEPRQVRKAYGLGGPRQEEEELEDSD